MNLLKFKSKNNYLNIFILGIITATIIFIPFLIMDKGLFLYYGDYNVQQIPFYKLAHEAVREGAFGWNWLTDLGVNFIGSYSFYMLGSPFFWLTLIFPTSFVPYLMAPLFVLKFGLTAVTGYAFISRFTRFKNTAMLGALLYAFSGFNIYNIFFNHFSEVVLVFPLLLIGVEELVINNRRGGFALVVALSAMMNYYFFFGEVIFVVIYFLIRCMDKNFPVTFKKFLLLCMEAVLGLLLSAVLLLPSILAILGNTRLGSTLSGYDLVVYNKPQRYGLILSSFFFPPDIPARPNFFADADSKWSSVSMYLPMLSMAGVIAFLRGAKKHWAKVLIIVSIIIAFIPMTNAMFSALNYNYYARWFFMPLLIMALASCIALEKYMHHMKLGLIITSCFVAAFAVIGILPKGSGESTEFFKLPQYPDRFWAYVAIAIVGIILTALLIVMTRKHKHFMITGICGIVGVTLVFSVFMLYCGRLAGDGYDLMVNRALAGKEELVLPDDGEQFYRIDTFGELDNLGMFWGKPSLNAFHSIVPSSVMNYYTKIGGERGVASRPNYGLVGVRALTATKYCITGADKPAPSMPSFEFIDTQLGYNIYENKSFVPVGFTYDSFITKGQFASCPKSLRDRLLLKGLLLEDADYEKYGHLLPAYEQTGLFEKVLTDEEYIKDCELLADEVVTDFVYDSKGFSAKISTAKDNLVFFSVPYDEGFTATVNSVATPVLEVNGGFMAVPVPAGNSVIEFSYHTPGLNIGLIITIISAILLVTYILIYRYLRQKNSPYVLPYQKSAHLHSIVLDDTDILARDAYISKVVRRKKK